ncbi:AAA family ATPase [Kitasatospora sp. NPDC002227]|uniref:ATP-binding protein n=1 Tax=Kitasatospora sp. NPDC002227 TaxID=3154773 RepID=UPI003316A3FF
MSESPPGAFPLVGRARELELLLAAARRPPATVLVEGEAGIGKSRLVREAAARLAREGHCVLTGHCHPLREPLPYGPLVDALQKAGPWLPAEGLPVAAAPLARLLPSLADRLPSTPPRPPDPPTERLLLVQAVRALLASLGPAVVIVEDAHWADEATRDLLLLLARDPLDQLCTVLTYRAEDLAPDTPVLGAAYRPLPGTGGTVLRLGPLTGPDIRELARAALGERATAELADSLYRRSEGLPLVAEEDLLTLREQHPGPDDPVERLRDADVPRGLREAVTERLARLSPPAATVVAAAAVLAVPSTEQVLGAVAGLDESATGAALVEALRCSILRESDGHSYAFRHTLAQQVAYRRLPGPTRRRLHAATVDVLERQTPQPLVQIAHHALALGDRPAWLRRTEAAAAQAAAVGDQGTATTLLRQLLQQPDTDSRTRSAAALDFARLASQGVDYNAGATALREILADHRVPARTRGEIRVGYGLLLLSQAADRQGFAELAQAVAELGDSSPEALPAMAALALDESATREQAELWMARAEQAVRGTPDAELAARVRATRLTLDASTGHPAVWAALERLPRHGLDLGVLRQTARALANAGDCAIDLGEDGRAARLVTEGIELARASGHRSVELYGALNLLRLDGLAGRWAGLEERFDALATAHPDTPVVDVERAVFQGVLGLAQGRPGRAAEYFAQAAAVAAGQLSMTLAGRSAAGTAATRLAQGAPDQAWAGARTALAAVRRAGSWPKAVGLVPVAVTAALACDDRAAAEALADELAQALDGRTTPAATAELHTARGLLAEQAAPERAAEEHAAAHRIWQQAGRPYHAARAAELRARALAGVHPEQAAAALAPAADTYTALDATADLARLRRLEQDLGLTRPARPGRRGYGDRLSPREEEVAALLARNATNQEIADALFLSPRTVEHHVANVLKKLGTTRKAVPATRSADPVS